MSTIQVGIRIPSHLFQKLQERAVQVNASKTEVILSALADYLESTEDIPLTMRLLRLETQVGELQGSLEKLIHEGK